MAKPDSDAGQQEARDYANDYLRKLVHVELPVPTREQMLTRLLEPRQERQQQSQQIARRHLLERAGYAGAVLVLLAAVWMAMGIGARLHDHGAGDIPLLDIAPSALASSAVAPSASSATRPVAEAPSSPASGGQGRRLAVGPFDRQGIVQLETAADKRALPAAPWYVALLCIAVVGAALGWKRLRRYRDAVAVALGGAIREHDSPRFLNALRLWGPLVIACDPTPRQVKRFYNRARLLAAFESGALGIDEVQLVALAAADQATPELFKFIDDNHVDTDVNLTSVLKGADTVATSRMTEKEKKIWQEHIKVAGRAPTVDELKRFRQRVAGLEVR